MQHAAHTLEIDRLGGLAKNMKWTAASFLVGSAAICGLPPLNGFVSEFLIYLASCRSSSSVTSFLSVPGLLVIGGLALIGGLAAKASPRPSDHHPRRGRGTTGPGGA